MKILFLTNNFLPHQGGSRVYYYNICKFLPKGSVVAFTNKVKEWQKFDKNQEFKIYRKKLFLFPQKFQQLNEFWALLLMAVIGFFLSIKEKPNIIHCGEILPTGLAGVVLSKFFRIPFVIYNHAEDVGFLKGLCGEKKVAVSVLNKAARIIVSCAAVKEKLAILGIKREKIIKITPGISEEFLKNIPEKEVKWFKEQKGIMGKKILLTTGRLIKRKNHRGVLEALREIVKEFPDVVYVIVGEGPQRRDLEEEVKKLRLNSNVRLEGSVSQEELIKFYASCDVFIMVSKELPSGDIEGFGIVFLEAASQAKPVIGSKVSGAGDAIADGVSGLFVDPNDTRAIAESIRKLLGDQELAHRLGARGRERVLKEFGWKQRAEAIERLCKTICQSHKKEKSENT